MGFVRLDDISFGDDDVDAAFRKWREAIEAAHKWSVSGAAHFEGGLDGYALHVKSPNVVKIAKTGGSAIPAMSGTTPGSGDITLYYFDGTELVEGDADTAKNLHPTEPVDADKWLKVIRIDGVWWVFWEPC